MIDKYFLMCLESMDEIFDIHSGAYSYSCKFAPALKMFMLMSLGNTA